MKTTNAVLLGLAAAVTATLTATLLIAGSDRAPKSVPERAAASLFRPSGSPIPCGEHPGDVAAAEVNGDGRMDLLVASGASGVIVLLGDGRGGFTKTGVPAPSGLPDPHLIATGEVNGDRRVDLAVSSHDSASVAVLLGDGRGGFAPGPGSPFAVLRAGTPHNHGLALADLDGDRRLDIVTSNANDASVSVLSGDGTGRFAPRPDSPFVVGRSPYPPAIGDLDGDGKLDIVTPDVGGGTLTVLLGTPDGFRPAPLSPIVVTARPYHASLARIDAGPTLDLVVTHDDVSLVTVLLGDGRGRFQPAPGKPLDAGHRGWRTAAADLDGDGRTDLAIGTGSGAIVLLGDGHGRFAPAPGSPYPTGRGGWNLALADVDSDGAMDVVTANNEDGTLTVLLGNRPKRRTGAGASAEPR